MYCSYDLNSKVMKIILGYEDVRIAVILYICIGMSIFGGEKLLFWIAKSFGAMIEI